MRSLDAGPDRARSPDLRLTATAGRGFGPPAAQLVVASQNARLPEMSGYGRRNQYDVRSVRMLTLEGADVPDIQGRGRPVGRVVHGADLECVRRQAERQAHRGAADRAQ